MAGRKRLGEILVNAGVLQESQLRAALVEQRRWGGPLGRILVDMKLIPEETMVQALSHQLNFPAVNLDGRQIDPAILDSIPGELAEQHSVIPFHAAGKFLDVAMSDPTNLGIIDELRIRTRLNVRPYLAGPKMIERALQRHYGRGGSSGLELGGAAGGLGTIDPATVSRPITAPPISTGAPDAPMPTTSSAALRRAEKFEFASSDPTAGAAPNRDREIASLQARVQQLEALVARDEDVLRKVLALLVEKGVATREEILERING